MGLKDGGEVGSVVCLGAGAEEFCDLGEWLVKGDEGEVACGPFECMGDGEGGVEVVGLDSGFEGFEVWAVE